MEMTWKTKETGKMLRQKKISKKQKQKRFLQIRQTRRKITIL